MKKRMERITAVLLAMLPSAAFAAEGTDSPEEIVCVTQPETHEGIGSVEDSIPFSQLPATLGLVDAPGLPQAIMSSWTLHQKLSMQHIHFSK